MYRQPYVHNLITDRSCTRIRLDHTHLCPDGLLGDDLVRHRHCVRMLPAIDTTAIGFTGSEVVQGRRQHSILLPFPVTGVICIGAR